MAKLILGPILRRVAGDQAILWFQTDAPATVRVTAGPAVASAGTRDFEGAHLAWVVLTGLPQGATAYQVDLDGDRVWPRGDFPPSVITIRPDDRAEATVVFGSCREPNDHGVDALVAYAERAIAGAALPDVLALIGDQIYADNLSPAVLDWLSTQDRPEGAPPHQVVTFPEYARLYLENWSVPPVRWLLSTIPTYMIFDDHEIIDDWNSSASWLADIRTRPWWAERIRAGLTSYHLFQHLGNLHPDQFDPDRLPSRWSFTVDIGQTRLVMMDCRGSRVLDGATRRMFPQAEWDWLTEQTQADCRHLVLACSLPWLLAPTIHHGEAVMEVLSHRFGGAVERLRRRYDLEHWSAVGHSFAELTSVIAAATKPATVRVIGGDVHHSYVARAFLAGRPDVLQVVSSPLNNNLSAKLRRLLRLGWVGGWLTGRDRSGVRWKPLMRPYFGNAIGTLIHNGQSAEVRLEAPQPDGTLTQVYPSRSA